MAFGLGTILICLLVVSTVFGAEESAPELKTTGKLVKECDCVVQQECAMFMHNQIRQCFDVCWTKNSNLTKMQSGLKQCVRQQEYFAIDLMDCMQKNMDSCVNDGVTKMVKKVDIPNFINQAEKKVESKIRTFVEAMQLDDEPVLGSLIQLGKCIKQCYLDKNKQGFCSDRHGCQFLIESNRVKSAWKRCISEFEWEERATEFCTCNKHAQTNNLDDFCKILEAATKAISEKGKQ